MRMAGDHRHLVYEPELITEFNRMYRRSLPPGLGRLLYEPEGVNNDMRLLGEMDRLRAGEVSISTWPRYVLDLYNQWSNWKDASGLLDFTDLVIRATAMLPVHPANPRMIFVDEAQDLSRLEMRLIKQWSEGTEKTIIAGDDQQALYEWRGASVKDFIEFAPEENTYVLPHSHRMRHAVYVYAREVGDRITLKKQKDFQPVGPGGEVTRASKPNFLRKLVEDTDQNAVMLLATCGYMLNPFLIELRKMGVPFHNPYRMRQEGKTWNPLQSRDAQALALFFRDNQPYTWHELYVMTSYLEDPGPDADLIMQHKSDNSYATDVRLPPEFDEALMDTNHLAYWLLMKTSVRFPRAGVKGITPMAYLFNILRREGFAGLKKTPNLIVGTIHSVKGGEADVVYLLPYLSPQAHRAYSSAAGYDSVLRTQYVGVSRARTKLVLVTDPSSRRVMWR